MQIFRKRELKEGSRKWFRKEYYVKRTNRLYKASKWSKFIIYLLIAQILLELDLAYLIPIMILPETYIYLDSWVYAIRQKRKFKRQKQTPFI